MSRSDELFPVSIAAHSYCKPTRAPNRAKSVKHATFSGKNVKFTTR